MSQSRIIVSDIESRRHARDFLDVPARVYQGDQAWISPLRAVEKKRIDPGGHPFYRHGTAKFWVAYRDGRPAGRIGATVNSRYIEHSGEPVGHFAMLEAEDDAEVFDALLDTAEGWLVARGMRAINGPFNLSLNEEPGVLVEGFDRPPTVMMGHARPYYAAHLERRGYGKEMDLLACIGPVASATLDTTLIEPLRRFAKSANLTLRCSTRRTFYADLVAAFRHYNEAWVGNWGHIPMTDAEIADSAQAIWVLMSPEALVFAERDGEIVGVVLAMPDVNQWIDGLGGRLAPLGWAKLLYRRLVGYADTARIMIAGVRRDLQGSALGGAIPLLLLSELRNVTPRYRPKFLEGSWILETNEPMLRFCDRAGFQRYKTYRIYRRDLAAERCTG